MGEAIGIVIGIILLIVLLVAKLSWNTRREAYFENRRRRRR